ncbi:hypothetical protein B0T16DRAFT_386104 [Cercophora newfieldiana]|uniref:Uncharacterized protein n=1 Tax=Cercophora newfieldiana TaxID=92897 RepID=A0AA39YTC4_9PEZI|nr:hypothetical protein B0T16DRAFT_386104 [Cercophora newfieldiana]
MAEKKAEPTAAKAEEDTSKDVEDDNNKKLERATKLCSTRSHISRGANTCRYYMEPLAKSGREPTFGLFVGAKSPKKAAQEPLTNITTYDEGFDTYDNLRGYVNDAYDDDTMKLLPILFPSDNDEEWAYNLHFEQLKDSSGEEKLAIYRHDYLA